MVSTKEINEIDRSEHLVSAAMYEKKYWETKLEAAEREKDYWDAKLEAAELERDYWRAKLGTM